MTTYAGGVNLATWDFVENTNSNRWVWSKSILFKFVSKKKKKWQCPSSSLHSDLVLSKLLCLRKNLTKINKPAYCSGQEHCSVYVPSCDICRLWYEIDSCLSSLFGKPSFHFIAYSPWDIMHMNHHTSYLWPLVGMMKVLVRGSREE